MFTMDLKGKHDIITYLTIQCLERYAKGYYCVEPTLERQADFSDWLDDLEFHRSDRTQYGEDGKTMERVDVLSFERYRIGNQSASGMALLAHSPKGAVCCAGGLSLTLIAEWVLYHYLNRYAELLGDSCSVRDFPAQFENMRERVEVILKNNSAIRCCAVDHCYVGYATVPRLPELEKRRGESDSAYRRRFAEALRQNEWYTVSGGRWAPAQKFYRFTREPCCMKVYLLDRCYDIRHRPLSAAKSPDWTRTPSRYEEINTLIPVKDGNWSTLSEPLALEEGKLYISPAAKLYAHRFLRVTPGNYQLIWHQTAEKVDHILLARRESSTGLFAGGEGAARVELDETFWNRCNASRIRRFNGKLQKAACIGLSARRDFSQTDPAHPAVSPQEGIRLFYENGALEGIAFSNAPKKDFRIGFSSQETGTYPELICLYTA